MQPKFAIILSCGCGHPACGLVLHQAMLETQDKDEAVRYANIVAEEWIIEGPVRVQVGMLLPLY